MEIRTLKQLVRQGEGERLEFKLKTNHPDKIVREMVAFANTSGGWVLIGVSDNQEIKGLTRPDEDEYQLHTAIDRYCHPALPYAVEKIRVADDREVLAYHIHKSPERPHFVQDASGKQKAYFRIGEKSIQASSELCEILRRSREPILFTYGDRERRLMRLLEQQPVVTVSGFAKSAAISREEAAGTLVLMVLANVIQIHPDETEDQFSVPQEP